MEVKLLLVFNIKKNREDEYFKYMLGEFLPTLQNINLYMVEGWHTAYGDYPMRLLIFRADSEAELHTILQGDTWQEAKGKLLKLVQDYEKRIVPAQNTFQFFIPDNPLPN